MKVKLIYGCHCSGKTTYVREHIGKDDVVYDYDTIAAALRLSADHPADAGTSGRVSLDLRQAVADQVKNRKSVRNFWFVCTWPSDQVLEILKDFDNVERIFMDESKKTCLDRMEKDDTRADKDAWRAIINAWFKDHADELDEARKDTNNRQGNRRFWNWVNLNESVTERTLTIDGVIASESWFDDDVTPEMFRSELNAGSGDIVLYINSPGGDCVAASQIYTMLMEYTGSVTVRVDGMAASAASVIAMAGTTVEMAPTAMMMIHNPATMAFGDHNDMAKAIDLLNEVKESIINAYEIKTGLSRAKISRLMEDETWMNAKKALELGFIDRIMTREADTEPAAAAAFAYSGHSAEDALRRKLVAKYGTKPKPKDTSGRRADELIDRLNTIRY